MNKDAVSKWIDAIVLGLVVLLLVNMAFLFTTRTTDTNLFKELSMVLLVPVCFFVFIAKFLVKGRFKLTSSPMNVPILIFLAIAALSFCTHPKLMFFSKITFIKYLCFGGAFFLMASLIRTRAQLKIVLYTMAVMAFLCAVYGLMQKFPDGFKWLGFTREFKQEDIPHFPLLKGLIIWARHPRIPSTFGNPNFFAAYIVLMTPVVFGMIAASKKIIGAVLAGSVAAILTLCIVLTQTRGGWLGYAAGFLIYLLFFIFTVERDRVAHKPVFWICAAAFFIAATVYLSQSPIVSKRIKHTIANMQSGQGTVDSRSIFYKGTLNMFEAKPVFGQGVGSFQIRFPFYRPNDYRMHRVSHNTRHSHSEYLQLLGEMGIIGLLAFLVVIGAAVKTTWRTFIVGKNNNHRLISIGLLMILLAFLAYVVVNPGMIITTLIGVAGLGLIFVTLLLSGKKTFCYAGDRYYRHIALGLFASIIGILVHNLVSVNLRWVEAGFFLWFNMGLLVAVARLEQEQRQRVADKKSKDAPELEEKTFRLVPISKRYQVPAIAVFIALALVIIIPSRFSIYWHYINFYKSEMARKEGTESQRYFQYLAGRGYANNPKALELLRKAEKAFEQSIHYYHQNLSSRYKLAAVYGGRGNWQKANKEYMTLIKYAPHYTEVHVNLTTNNFALAVNASKEKNNKKVKSHLDEALKQAKLAVKIQDSSRNRLLLAKAYINLNEMEDAEEEYQMAMKRARQQIDKGISGMKASEIVLEWTNILERKKLTGKSQKELQNIYDKYQAELTNILNDVYAGYSFNNQYNITPLMKKALNVAVDRTGARQLEKLHRDYNGMHDISISLARLHAAKKPAETEKILRGILLEYPNDSTTSYYLGIFYYMQKSYFKARTELERALRLTPKAPWAEQTKKILANIEKHI
jgi:O-antigen ligase/tetratricopeptide (TPR) repeat protein